jgi:hypothetical protein
VCLIVPLIIIKGAGDKHITLCASKNALIADFHTTRTKTDAHHLGVLQNRRREEEAGQYMYVETKYGLERQLDVLVRRWVALVFILDANNEGTG